MSLVAVAHYPEGSGHATRMLAVARELERRGATVRLAGGGPGATFARLNGYEEFEPTRVDYIGDYQGGGSLVHVFRNSVPDSGRRVRDYVGWLRDLDPAALVTDDMFAAVAAHVAGVPLYVLTHNAPFLYEGRVERAATLLWTVYQRGIAREFLYPAVWPQVPGDPRGPTRIPPVALAEYPGEGSTDDGGGPARGDDGRAGNDGGPTGNDGDPTDGDPAVDPGVLVVPSHYSTDPNALADRVREAGHRVTLVGDEDWEPLPSLLPAIRAADAVVCSGYSTVMEAAVAGTPCVMVPRTDEQRGVGRVLSATATEGVAVVGDADGVAAALADPPTASPRENGAERAAERILASL